MKPPAVLPITPLTVTINGLAHHGRSMIWAGLRLSAGSTWRHPDRRCLCVPWCHVDETRDGAGDPIYTLRPRDGRYQFARARNGAWILKMENENAD